MSDMPITDQLKDILLLVGQILHVGTQQDLDKFHLWLADYAEVVTARRPQEAPMPDITPGQVAHAAYVDAEPGVPVPPGRVATRWRCLLPSEQRGWEAAAQAVLAMQEAEGIDGTGFAPPGTYRKPAP